MTFVLNNIRSAFNVGSSFRTSDSLGANLILVGYTPKPIGKNLDLIKKTAIGSESSVHWEGYDFSAEVFEKYSNYMHLAIEINSTSQNLFQFLKNTQLDLEKVCLWFGNELYGLNQEVLSQCDHILHLDMQGIKESLNISSALCATGYLLKYNQFLKQG